MSFNPCLLCQIMQHSSNRRSIAWYKNVYVVIGRGDWWVLVQVYKSSSFGENVFWDTLTLLCAMCLCVCACLTTITPVSSQQQSHQLPASFPWHSACQPFACWFCNTYTGPRRHRRDWAVVVSCWSSCNICSVPRSCLQAWAPGKATDNDLCSDSSISVKHCM